MYTENNPQLTSIEVSQLSSATGGSWWGSAVKLAEKAVPFIEHKAVPFIEHKALPFLEHKALPYLEHKAVQVAKWTGIPTVVGAGASWIKHEFGK